MNSFQTVMYCLRVLHKAFGFQCWAVSQGKLKLLHCSCSCNIWLPGELRQWGAPTGDWRGGKGRKQDISPSLCFSSGMSKKSCFSSVAPASSCWAGSRDSRRWPWLLGSCSTSSFFSSSSPRMLVASWYFWAAAHLLHHLNNQCPVLINTLCGKQSKCFLF